MDNELLCLLRQFKHNNSDEFVSGFDRDGVIALVSGLRAELAEANDAGLQLAFGIVPAPEQDSGG